MRLAVLHHLRAFTQQSIYYTHHVRLVPWNWVTRENNHITRLDLNILVRTRHHAVQHRVHLTLRARAHHRNLIVWQFYDVFHLHDSILWNLNHPSSQRHLDVVDHRESSKRHFAPALCRFVQNQLNPLHLARETTHNHPAIRIMVHHAAQILTHIIFRMCMFPWAVNISAFIQE